MAAASELSNSIPERVALGTVLPEGTTENYRLLQALVASKSTELAARYHSNEALRIEVTLYLEIRDVMSHISCTTSRESSISPKPFPTPSEEAAAFIVGAVTESATYAKQRDQAFSRRPEESRELVFLAQVVAALQPLPGNVIRFGGRRP